jgi:hypothetical protein
MHPNVLLPLTSSLLSLVFAVLVFDQYLHRRKMYQLVWAVGLALYWTSAGTEFLGGAFGWSADLFRWWYLLGAIGVAMYLGLGTIYLLGRSPFAWSAIAALVIGSLPAVMGPARPFGLACLVAAGVLALARWKRPAWFAHAFLAVTLLGTAYAAAVVFAAPVDASLLPTSVDQVVSGQAFPASVRILTPVFNITGAFALSFGAAYSAYYFWRTRTKPHRMISNVLIAVGAFIPGLTSGLSRFGLTSAFFVGELLGVLCILVGFLVSVEVFSTYRIPIVGTILRARAPSDEGV